MVWIVFIWTQTFEGEAQVLLKTITFIDVLRLENVSLSCVTHYCLHCLYKFVKVATWNYMYVLYVVVSAQTSFSQAK